MLGAEIIASILHHAGVKRVFLFPGGTIAPVLEALRNQGIELFCSRHEQGAGYGAIGAARATGDIQVVLVSSGPGATNAVTPLADAYFDSLPVLFLTGQVGTADMRRPGTVRQKGFQETDTAAIMAPIAKAVHVAKSPDDLPETVTEALKTLTEGRPGPVVVDLPMDVQRGEAKSIPTAYPADTTAAGQAADDPTLQEMAAAIAAAKRPVIIAGAGCRSEAARNALRRLARHAGIPVSQSLPALGAFPTDDALSLGFHGHTGNQTAGLAIQNADLLLVLGSRLDLRQTGTETDDFAPGARILRIDIDAAEIAHARTRLDMVLQADLNSALPRLADLLEEHEQAERRDWQERIAAWKRQYPLTPVHEGGLKPQTVIETVDALTRGQKVVVSSGVGSHQQWAARHFTYDLPDRIWLTSAGHGAMGYDLPAIIGAAIGLPDALPICFVGDGSFQINIQELGAIAEVGLPVKIFLLDNRRLGIVSQFQNFNWQRDLTCGDKANPDFAAIAEGYGITALRLEDPALCEESCRAILETPGPALLHCLIDPREDVSPMLMAGQRLDGMWPYRT